MTIIWSDGFESGNYSAWSSYVGTIECVTDIVHHGIYASKCTFVPVTGSWYQRQLPSTYSDLYTRCYARFSELTADNNYVQFLSISNTAATDFAVMYVWRISGVMRWQLYTPTLGYVANYDVSVTPDTWYCVAIRRKVGTGDGITQVWIDGTLRFNYTATTNTLNSEYINTGCQDSNQSGYIDYTDCHIAADTYMGLENTQVSTNSISLSDFELQKLWYRYTMQNSITLSHLRIFKTKTPISNSITTSHSVLSVLKYLFTLQNNISLSDSRLFKSKFPVNNSISLSDSRLFKTKTPISNSITTSHSVLSVLKYLFTLQNTIQISHSEFEKLIARYQLTNTITLTHTELEKLWYYYTMQNSITLSHSRIELLKYLYTLQNSISLSDIKLFSLATPISNTIQLSHSESEISKYLYTINNIITLSHSEIEKIALLQTINNIITLSHSETESIALLQTLNNIITLSHSELERSIFLYTIQNSITLSHSELEKLSYLYTIQNTISLVHSEFERLSALLTLQNNITLTHIELEQLKYIYTLQNLITLTHQQTFLELTQLQNSIVLSHSELEQVKLLYTLENTILFYHDLLVQIIISISEIINSLLLSHTETETLKYLYTIENSVTLLHEEIARLLKFVVVSNVIHIERYLDNPLADDELTLDTTTTRVGQRLIINAYINRVDFKLRKFGSPSGTVYARIRKLSDDSIIEESPTTISANSISETSTWYSFDFNSYVDEEAYVLVERE